MNYVEAKNIKIQFKTKIYKLSAAHNISDRAVLALMEFHLSDAETIKGFVEYVEKSNNISKSNFQGSIKVLATQIMNELEGAGFVRKTDNKSDKRQKKIQILTKGKKLIDEINKMDFAPRGKHGKLYKENK